MRLELCDAESWGEFLGEAIGSCSDSPIWQMCDGWKETQAAKPATGIPESRSVRVLVHPTIRDGTPPIPHGFHTKHRVRTADPASPGQTTNAQIPVKQPHEAHTAGSPADPPCVRTLMVRHGKGGKNRLLRAALRLDHYLVGSRPQGASGSEHQTAMFLSGYGTRITPAYLGNWVAGQMKQAGVTLKGSSHLFRHSCATAMHAGGADIRYVQEMLGHARLETTQIYTQIYTHVHIAALTEVHARCHPHGREPRFIPDSTSVSIPETATIPKSEPITGQLSAPPRSLPRYQLYQSCPSRRHPFAPFRHRPSAIPEDPLTRIQMRHPPAFRQIGVGEIGVHLQTPP